jgi:hypothetical protein
MHHREDGHLVAELFLVEQSAVALDIARLLQRADAAQARRRRDSDATRQLHVGDAAVLLQLLEDLAVDGVESGGHKGTPQRAAGSTVEHSYREIIFRETILRTRLIVIA